MRPSNTSMNPSTDSASETSNIDITGHVIPAPAMREASFQTLFKSTTPANEFLRLPRDKQFEPPKTAWDRQFLTILTSKSLSRHSVV